MWRLLRGNRVVGAPEGFVLVDLWHPLRGNCVVGAPEAFIFVDLWSPLRGNRVVGGTQGFILVAFLCICGTHYAVNAQWVPPKVSF